MANLYTKTYRSGEANLYLGQLFNAHTEGQFSFGSVGNGIAIFKLDDNGNPVFGKKIEFGNKKLSFISALQLPEGDFAIIAQSSRGVGIAITPHLIRINPEGEILDHLMLDIDYIRNIHTMLILDESTFFIVLGYIESAYSKSDNVCCVTVTNPGFKRTSSFTFPRLGDDQYRSAFIHGDHILLYGGTAAGVERAFVVSIKTNVEKVTRYAIDTQQIIPRIDKIIFDEEQGLLLFGNYRKNGKKHPVVLKASLGEEGLHINSTKVFQWDEDEVMIYDVIKYDNSYCLVAFDYPNHLTKLVELDNNLNLKKIQSFDFEDYRLTRFQQWEEKLQIIGFAKVEDEKYEGLIIQTDHTLESCRAIEEDIKETWEEEVNFVSTNLDFIQIHTSQSLGEISVEDIDVAVNSICDSEPNDEIPFELAENHLIQSPYLNLQAAGSLGSDSVKGNHLRWLLSGYLGDNHLPKGEHATNTNFFNKPEDFVHIYKIPYQSNESLWDQELDVFNEYPVSIATTECTWVYQKNERTYYLSFENKTAYSSISQSIGSIDNLDKTQDLLQQYGSDVLKLEVKGALSFAVNIIKPPNTTLYLESFSVQNKSYAEDVPVISARKIVHPILNNNFGRIVAENISFIKFSIDAGLTAFKVVFETYSDLLQEENISNLGYLGAYALEPQNQEEPQNLIVSNRLEDPSKFTVDNHWNKFSDNQKVRTENYKSRWDGNFGLGHGVSEYITKSDTDPKAVAVYDEALNSEDTSKMEVSYLDFVTLASLDYHNARMLGLGCIDVDVNDNDRDKFIYLAVYNTIKNPENYNEVRDSQHLYFSLPTGLKDERLPLDVKMLPISYGLNIDNATNTPLLITDKNGYAFKMNTRYINLNANLDIDYAESNAFFNPNIEFESSEFSSPVFVGFKNKKHPDENWATPDLLHEEAFYSDDAKSIEENALAIFNDSIEKPNYTHLITEEGVADFAAFAVNLFYRAGDLSNLVSTDDTKFPIENTLQPPSNIRAHVIQEEGTPMLTSAVEQSLLKNIPNDDVLIRLTFDYNHVQDKNYNYVKDEKYNFGEKVLIYHKKTFPNNIIGGITSVYDDVNPNYVIIETGNFDYKSTEEIFIPTVEQTHIPNYIGSLLSFASKKYEVIDIIQINADGTYPKIKLKKNEVRTAMTVGTSSQPSYQLDQSFEGPVFNKNEAFLLIENMLNPSSWKDLSTPNDNKLDLEIELASNQFTERTETYKDDQGKSQDITVRGIWDDCEVIYTWIKNEYLEENGIRVKDDDGNNIILKTYGRYDIKFNKTVLDAHPQFISPDNAAGISSVEWFQGVVRIHSDADSLGENERLVLKVAQILNVGTSDKLHLIAIHSAVPNTESIKTGSNISVNFYPGYKAYLRKDASALFDDTTVLPDSGEGKKETLLGLQTIDYDVVDNNHYKSGIGVPTVLIANEIIQLSQPSKPEGPLYSTPPDFYDKSSYSFNTAFEKTPWGVVFLRADINRILSILYDDKTLKKVIYPSILPITADENFQARWDNLLSMNLGTDNQFKAYVDVNGDSFNFPSPDNKAFIPDDLNLTVGTDKWKAHIKHLITTCLLPLTEHPIVFEYIKDGAYIPQPGKQKLRDKNGKILSPSEFDMAPMAKKISNKEVLFTDFTLDGNMDINTAYVYAVREMNKALKFGELSEFLGPVQLLNTAAPAPVTIRTVSIKTPNYENDFSPSVVFEVNKIHESQNVSKIQIFRLDNSVDALNPRDIAPVKEIELEDIDTFGETFFIEDDFSDLTAIPYGNPIYYNLIGIKKIEYKDYSGDKKLFVSSESSKTLVTNIVDTSTPEKPALTISKLAVVNDKLDFEITWEKCCYKGKYSIWLLNDFNNWELIGTEETDTPNYAFEYNQELIEKNEDGDIIYHKIKVEVENTIGIRNVSNILSIPN